MNIKKNTAMVTCILVAALLSVAVAGCGDSQPAAVSSDTEAKEATVVHLEHVEWKSDTRYTFGLTLSSKADVSAQGAMFDIDLSADLVVVPVETTPRGLELLFTVENPVFHYEQKSEEKTKQFDQLAKEIKVPFFASYENGRLSAVHLLKDTTAFAAGIQRSLAADFQNVPSDTPAEKWEVTEYDATGAYVAEYSVDEKTGAIKKRKVKYTKALKDKRGGKKLAQDIGLPQIKSSVGEFVVEKGTIKKITLVENIEMPVAIGSVIRSSTEISAALKEQKPAAASPSWRSLRESYKRYEKDEAFLSPVSEKVLDAARMRGMTFEHVVLELEETSKDPNRIKELSRAVKQGLDAQTATQKGKKWMGSWMRLFNALPAFFRQEPSTVANAVKRIEQKSAATESLLGGLSAAGTEASQKALLNLSNSKKLTKEAQESAMVSLVRCKNPQPSTITTLTKMLAGNDELRVYAQYGLGTMARNLRDSGNAEDSNAVAATLLQSLKQAKGKSEKRNILYGIANSGYAGALDVVRPFLSHDDPSLRSAALAAIRLMEHPEVDVLIAQAMDPQKEPMSAVREAAILAAKPREPSATLAKGLAHMALHEKKKNTRFKAVQLLGRWLPQRPELGKALQAIAQNDEVRIIRSTAAAAIKKTAVKP